MVGIAAPLSLGMAAQWTAWRIRVPAIILLLLFGFARGRIRVTALTETFDYDAFLGEHGERALPLFALRADGRLSVATVEKPLAPQPGDRVSALVDEPPASDTPPDDRGAV